jgi:hypothetical protein
METRREENIFKLQSYQNKETIILADIDESERDPYFDHSVSGVLFILTEDLYNQVKTMDKSVIASQYRFYEVHIGTYIL